MRLHFSWMLADIPYVDLIAIYDKSYRLVFRFEKQYPTGTWSPWIKGDTILVRFANALVATESFVEKEFRSPKDGFRAGATMCRTNRKTKKTICYIPKLSDPFANFESEGFHVDKLEYRTQEKNDAKKGKEKKDEK